jgi:hypothetical protein
MAALDTRGGAWKDLWGWVSASSTAQAVMLSITAPESTFPMGHESFFIVAPTTSLQKDTRELLEERYPNLLSYWDASGRKGNEGAFNTDKAERMLGWKEMLINRKVVPR